MIGNPTMIRTTRTLPLLALTLFAGACQSFDERYEASLPTDQRLPFQVATEVSLLDVQTVPPWRPVKALIAADEFM